MVRAMLSTAKIDNPISIPQWLLDSAYRTPLEYPVVKR